MATDSSNHKTERCQGAPQCCCAKITATNKKRLTFVTVGVFFLLGGVEYAVILPTAWFYLRDRFGSEPYMLGMLLSSYCLGEIIAGPIMGRWSDKTRTKVVLLFANLWQIVGNLMYCMDVSAWFLVIARFIAGIGTGVESSLFADIARVTSLKQRTAVMSIFIAIRQMGLLFGPGCNVFLREIDFYIGKYHIDKSTAPGAFMAFMWLILEILCIFLYWDLPMLKEEMDEEQKQKLAINGDVHSDPTLLPLAPTQSLPTSPTSPHAYIMSSPSIIMSTQNGDVSKENGFLDRETAKNKLLRVRHESGISGSEPILSSSGSNKAANSVRQFFRASPSHSTLAPLRVLATAISSRDINYPGVTATEPLDHKSSYSQSMGRLNDTNQNGVTVSNGSAIYYEKGKPSHLRQTRSMEKVNLEEITTKTSKDTKKKEPPRPGSFRFYYEEYMREEIIAIMTTVFVAYFNQTCLETLVTPLSSHLLDWTELENSILYCGGAVEVIIVFVIIQRLSYRFDDRGLMLFGFVIVAASVVYILIFLPTAPPHSPGKNLPHVILSVALNLIGLPFLMVTTASLSSKLTREDTQGFTQGVRKTARGVASLMGPLWGGSLIDDMYLMMGVMIGLVILPMGMLILSYKRMKPKESATVLDTEMSQKSSRDAEKGQPLLDQKTTDA